MISQRALLAYIRIDKLKLGRISLFLCDTVLHPRGLPSRNSCSPPLNTEEPQCDYQPLAEARQKNKHCKEDSGAMGSYTV